jgi:hypothetical protein
MIKRKSKGPKQHDFRNKLSLLIRSIQVAERERMRWRPTYNGLLRRAEEQWSLIVDMVQF